MAVPCITTLEQFMQRVEFDTNGGCWLWSRTRDTHGYGMIAIESVKIGAHRASWLFHFGDPGKMHVLHRCDVPACVNPAHLWLGTRSDNMRDMVAKGRRRGDLPTRIVANIKADLDRGQKHRQVMADYGVSAGTVSNIARGAHWAVRNVGLPP